MAVTDPVGPIEVDLTADLMDPGKAPRRSSRSMLIWYRLRATPRFWIGAIVVVGMIIWAIIGLRLTQWSPTDQDLINASTGPSSLHWFGTDDIGQDIYAETVSGLRKSLVIGLIAGPRQHPDCRLRRGLRRLPRRQVGRGDQLVHQPAARASRRSSSSCC